MGSSWGGMLALAYALKYQENLKTIISTGGLVNSRVCANEMSSCRYGLPRDVQETLAKYEALWAFWHPDYLKAVDTYYHHFFCRLPDWPEEVTKAVTNVSVPVYFTMWGPNEFTLSGNLKDLDFTDRLGEIHVPTLVTGGRFDEVTPRVAETIHSRVPNSVLRIFEKSAHLAMWEEQDAYLETVRKFIRER
jgi:proline iminopeptidase